MEFEQKLGAMQEKIMYSGEKISYKYSAEYWNSRLGSKLQQRKIFDPIFQRIFDKDFDFPERREKEIEVTLEELLMNSYSACDELPELFVELISYFGKEGIVIHVRDEGPGFKPNEKITWRRANLDQLTDEMVLYDRGSENYPGGTAMYCLLKFANDFMYSETGNQVVVRFDLKPF